MKMNEDSKAYRQRVIDKIEGIANPSAQIEYERNVPIADVPAELVIGFVDDLYHPKSELFLNAFTSDELKDLAELYGRLCVANDAFIKNDCHSVADIQKLSEWRSVMAFAQELLIELKGMANFAPLRALVNRRPLCANRWHPRNHLTYNVIRYIMEL